MTSLFGLFAAPLMLVAATAVATAQDYPTGPVTIVVPFGAGTSTDQVARVLGSAMSADLDQPFVYENRPGAGGSLGTMDVVQAAPDGYTLSMGTVGTMAINHSLYQDLPYDPLTDLTPIALVGYTPTLLVVNGGSDYMTLEDLVAASMEGEGLTFSSAGNGTSGHLAGELLAIESGGQMLHIPFNSGAEGLTAVMSGEVDFMFYHPVAALPSIEAGTLRALGVSGADGSPVAPDVSAIAETYPEFDLVAWFLLAGPAEMPDELVQRLHDAVMQGLSSETVVSHFDTNGIQAGKIAAAELPGFVESEIAKWEAIAQAANASVD